MKRLAAFKNMTHEEWLRYRKKGITGTDAGAIVGLHPYRSAFAVYQDKLSDEIEQIDNEAMRLGRDLEEYVARRFCEETGKKVRKANAIYQNEDHLFMLADFDRLIVGERSGLECKTVSPYAADQWKDGATPIHYQMQVQHYLAVCGYDCWYIAALIFGKGLVIRKIERDEELIQYLVAIEERFWTEHVLAHVMPDPDGSENCSEMIAKTFFHGQKEKAIMLNGYVSVLERRNELDLLIKKMEKEKAEIDQRIKLQMQDATVAVEGDYRISWSNFEQNRLDTKKLKEEQPEIYQKYCKSSIGRRFCVNRAA